MNCKKQDVSLAFVGIEMSKFPKFSSLVTEEQTLYYNPYNSSVVLVISCNLSPGYPLHDQSFRDILNENRAIYFPLQTASYLLGVEGIT